MELGEKLRQARQEAGLSQRELCGDTVTRNMLSQIEHGNASPSIGTLRLLARRLGKPVGYFLDEDCCFSPNRERMELAARAMTAGNWQEAQRLLKEYASPDPVYDGVYPVLCQTVLLGLAEQAVRENRSVYARELLDRLTLFPRQMVEGGLEIDLDVLLLQRAEEAMDAPDRAEAYLTAAENRENPRWQLLMGRVLAERGEYARARDCLHRAEEAFPKETAPLLERCYRELEDFRQAYFYACKQK